MTATDWSSVILSNATLLAESVRAAGLDAPVPTCPEWKAADLAEHIMGVHSWVETMVRTRSMEYLDRSTLPPAPSAEDGVDAVCVAVQERAGALVRTLEEAGPDEPVWNWSVNLPKMSGFWPRRMGQETVIHAADAASMLGGLPTVAADVAVDGIDELVGVFLPARAAYRGDVALGGTVHVHCTDVEGEWLVSAEGAVVDVTRAHGKGDAAVRGPASAVLYWLWNRLPFEAGEVERFGDAAVLERWRAFAV